MGARLLQGVEDLGGDHPSVGDVRGKGLLVGVELVKDRSTREPATELAVEVLNELRDRGFLIGVTGRAENVLKIRPPLVFGEAEADLLLGALDEALSSIHR